MNSKIAIEQAAQAFKNIPGPKGKFLVGNLFEIDFGQFHRYLKQNAKKIWGDISPIPRQ